MRGQLLEVAKMSTGFLFLLSGWIIHFFFRWRNHLLRLLSFQIGRFGLSRSLGGKPRCVLLLGLGMGKRRVGSKNARLAESLRANGTLYYRIDSFASLTFKMVLCLDQSVEARLLQKMQQMFVYMVQY